jgi:V/A-type H+-transporting ATPase subunit C
VPADFGYINARVKGMRARLLPPGRVEELLALPTLDAFLQAINSTPYATELQEALSRYQGLRAVDEALMQHFQRAVRKLLSFAEGRPRHLIEVVLMNWDLHNLLTVLRGKHAGRAGEDVESNFVPAGTLTEARLKELSQQPDVAAISGTLATWEHPLARPLGEALYRYLQGKDLMALELHTQRYYYEWALRAVRGTDASAAAVRRSLEMEIDYTNIKTAYKLRLAKDMPRAERENFFVPGGLLSPKVFTNLADAESAEVGLREVRARGLHPSGDSPAEVERWAADQLTRHRLQLYLGDPLGIDVVLGYLAMLHEELKNLRLIARAKVLGIPRDVVRREMALA